VIISATGAWCLAYYRSAFTSIAFVLAIAMILSAVFLIAAYILSGKKRLPETVLVEGMITLLFGFVVLNNEVPDTALVMFFGAWLAITGSIRFSQSLAVSRIDPYSWAKVLPMAILNTVAGLIMLMHSLVSQANQLTLIGVAMMLNGLSLLVYAMYMVKPEARPQVAQARARVEAKQAAAEERRKERDELRRLTRSEREAKLREIRLAAEAEAENKRRIAQLEKEKQRAARAALLDPTIQLSEEEIALIAGADTAEKSEGKANGPTYAQSETPKAENYPVKEDITDILDREVKKPEPIAITPLSAEELFSNTNKQTTVSGNEKKEDGRFTEEFSWTWPPKTT